MTPSPCYCACTGAINHQPTSLGPSIPLPVPSSQPFLCTHFPWTPWTSCYLFSQPRYYQSFDGRTFGTPLIRGCDGSCENISVRAPIDLYSRLEARPPRKKDRYNIFTYFATDGFLLRGYFRETRAFSDLRVKSEKTCRSLRGSVSL